MTRRGVTGVWFPIVGWPDNVLLQYAFRGQRVTVMAVVICRTSFITGVAFMGMTVSFINAYLSVVVMVRNGIVRQQDNIGKEQE